MGFLSGIFGGGGSSSSSTSVSNVTVTVNPEIQVANVVDLSQIQRLVDVLTESSSAQVAAINQAAVAEQKSEKERTQAVLDFLDQKGSVVLGALAVGGVLLLARK